MIVELSTFVGRLPVWKQERYVVHDTTLQGWRLYTDLGGSAADPLAVYTGGELYCDITDYLRTYPTVGRFYFADNEDPSIELYLEVQVVGLINPESVHIPPHALGEFGALVVPPRKMLITGDVGSSVVAEFYAMGGSWNVTGRATMGADSRDIGQIDDVFVLSDGTHVQRYAPRVWECGKTYAFVRWVSFSGVIREHIFEACKFKTDAAGDYSLLPVDNEYVNIKGRVDGMTLRLDGLSMYDVWYYADVITSSKVEVSMDGVNYTRVEVLTKNVTLPDGAMTDGKVEVQVNWKRYDAVAM